MKKEKYRYFKCSVATRTRCYTAYFKIKNKGKSYIDKIGECFGYYSSSYIFYDGVYIPLREIDKAEYKKGIATESCYVFKENIFGKVR